jgi:hypothetical protein
MSQISPTTTATRDAAPGMPLWAQRALAAAAVLALVYLLASIAQQVAAMQQANKPARVVAIAAGPYPLTVSLSRDPALAGFALPFAIAPTHPVAGRLTYTVTAIPDVDVDATPVNAVLTRDLKVANRVTGTVELTVRGPWGLLIAVDGPAGQAVADVGVTAQASGVIPGWIAWLIGLVPAAGIALYFAARRPAPAAAPPVESRHAGAE